MKCEEIREEMFDLVTAKTLAPEVQQHLDGCAACSAELVSMKQTMLLLDEWETPEPSPFFDTRLQALLREEKAKAEQKKHVSILDWFRKPVLAAAAAVALLVGAGVYAGMQNAARHHNDSVVAQGDPAIRDLQTLDKDQDVINNFAALDDDPTNDDQSQGTAE